MQEALEYRYIQALLSKLSCIRLRSLGYHHRKFQDLVRLCCFHSADMFHFKESKVMSTKYRLLAELSSCKLGIVSIKDLDI